MRHNRHPQVTSEEPTGEIMQSKLLPLTRRDRENRLDEALTEHVVFHSPVRDYHGRADVAHILTTIGEVLDTIESQRELVAERQVVTILIATRADHGMSGVLDETHDALGRVERATLTQTAVDVARGDYSDACCARPIATPEHPRGRNHVNHARAYRTSVWRVAGHVNRSFGQLGVVVGGSGFRADDGVERLGVLSDEDPPAARSHSVENDRGGVGRRDRRLLAKSVPIRASSRRRSSGKRAGSVGRRGSGRPARRRGSARRAPRRSCPPARAGHGRGGYWR